MVSGFYGFGKKPHHKVWKPQKTGASAVLLFPLGDTNGSKYLWWTSWYSESPPLSRFHFSKLIEYDKPIYEPFITSRFQLSIINHWWCIKEVTDMNGLVKITWRIPLLMGKQRRNTLWYENQWWIPTILKLSQPNWNMHEHAPEALPNLYLSYDT